MKIFYIFVFVSYFKMKATEKDLLIISRLREHSRESLTSMSKKTGIPISTLFDRLRSLKPVKRYTVLLDFEQLGYSVHAFVLLKVNFEKNSDVKKHLCSHSQINSLYKTNNGFTFLVEGVFESVSNLDEFIEHLQQKFGIEKYSIQYSVEEVKREGFRINH